MEKRRKVLIINTGGTIGMKSTEQGYEVAAGFLQEQLSKTPEIGESKMPDYEIFEFEPVMDSAQMTPRDWGKIAEAIVSRHDDFDCFLVLHGTDTMAYTASALAFLLQGLQKTVILTGSQIPLCETRNDARDNLVTALLIAAEHDIPEVCILFGEYLLRGCRATKASVYDFDAFRSPNYLPLGEIGTTIRIFERRFLQREPQPLQLANFRSTRLGTFRLFPGLSADVVENLLAQPLEALILETYGVGTGPANNRDFLNVLEKASNRGVVIVSCSQCEHGTVSPRDYAAGTALANAGVVSGEDMTIESAIAKLHFLLGQNLTIDEVRSRIGLNIVGELTPPAARN